MNAITNPLNPEDTSSPKRFAAKVGIAERELRTVLALSSDRGQQEPLSNQNSPGTEQKLLQTASILNNVHPWTGSLQAAWDWFRAFPIPPGGKLTAAEMVAQGRGDEVALYLLSISDGGYA